MPRWHNPVLRKFPKRMRKPGTTFQGRYHLACFRKDTRKFKLINCASVAQPGTCRGSGRGSLAGYCASLESLFPQGYPGSNPGTGV